MAAAAAAAGVFMCMFVCVRECVAHVVYHPINLLSAVGVLFVRFPCTPKVATFAQVPSAMNKPQMILLNTQATNQGGRGENDNIKKC